MLSSIELVGIVAACFTSTGLFPQIYKGIRTRRAQDVSWTMPAVIAVGTALWMVYGLLRADWIIVGANFVAFVTTVLLLIVKALYGRR